MKEFNLELAKANRPVQTRNGRPARIICYDRKGANDNYPIIALVKNHNNEEHPYNYTKDGTLSIHPYEDDLDLFMVPTKKEGWINLYKNSNSYYPIYRGVYPTKEAAHIEIDEAKEYIATTKIEWEE